MNPTFSRRALLRAAGIGAGAVALPSVVAACGGPSDTAASDGKRVAWPKYLPFAGPKADLPGSDVVQPGYTKYPSNIVQSVRQKPGDGSTVRVAVYTFGSPPTPLNSNKFWQAINDALGINLELTIIPFADLATKMQTLTASGDLPDLICTFFGVGLPHASQFLPAECADLSEYLSDDAVSAYPNLANIPTYAWQGMGLTNGRIFGVPIERGPQGGPFAINKEKFSAAGWSDTLTQDDFTAVCKKLTGDHKYALGGTNGSLGSGLGVGYHAGCLGAPNNWRNDGGTFVSAYTTPEVKASLGYVRDLFKAGLYYPDAMTTSQSNIQTLFYNQTVSSAWSILASSAFTGIQGAFTLDYALPYRTAAKPANATSNGYFGYTALKKAPKQRIEMLLRVLNYLASPFGTKEYELTHFGMEGVHFTRGADGAPQPTARWTGGENRNNLPIGYLCDAPQVLYFAGVPAAGITMLHDWQTKWMANASWDASRGLYSPTRESQGVTLDKTLTDGINAVVTGQASIDSWDSVLKNWKNAGGDAIAAEYAAANAANG
jgi:putative aldouronate transport system substrate-binding protein